MGEQEKERCFELARVLFGNTLATVEVERIIRQCSSYTDFRIALIASSSDRSEPARRVLEHWRSQVRELEADRDIGGLLHRLANVAHAQEEIDARLKEGMSELLEKLKVIDKYSASYTACKTALDDMRTQIAYIRARIEELASIPSKGEEVEG